jgi:anti-sigma regulatory factor (Ser/Thr protein kinase)
MAIELSADPAGVDVAARCIVALLDGVGAERAFACELAVAEACANVCRHADAGPAGRMRVVARAGAGRFAVAVCNLGGQFDAPGRPMPPADAEGGRGLPLIATCMDRVAWRYADGENRLLMACRLDSRP